MCAKSCTVGPQQYIPTFLPAGSSGRNSPTERVNVLNNLRPMLPLTGYSKRAGRKGKRISRCVQGQFEQDAGTASSPLLLVAIAEFYYDEILGVRLSPAAATSARPDARDCFQTCRRPTFLRPRTSALHLVAGLPRCEFRRPTERTGG